MIPVILPPANHIHRRLNDKKLIESGVFLIIFFLFFRMRILFFLKFRKRNE